ncbi:MAG: tRNA (adenosine(37)-N6)-threonylcarbamoyltransferase complex dimerization subunit type 1 TsaB [Nitrospirae bacterium]|nr:tRNA (adenosine(37)-N6)-threonylcarbamoyltransferase complex dimerization subunit type 1 TsaB [Nitrospirota bacterium]
MKVLAVDTSSEMGSVALLDTADGLMGCLSVNLLGKKNTHSNRLMPSIDFLLKILSFDLSSVELFAITLGPGSFTGLRVGLSTMKGFSFATGKPVAGVSTLEGLAWNFPYSRYPVCPIIDARRGEVYGALYEWSGYGFDICIEEGVYEAGELLKFAKDGAVFTGNGSVKYRALIEERLGGKAFFAQNDKLHVSAATIALLGTREHEKGRSFTADNLKPIYFKRPQAEEKLRDVYNHS